MRNHSLSPRVSVIVFVLMLLVSILGSCATAAEIAPKITFLAPPGNIYSIGDVAVSVSVTNFTIVDKQGQAAVPGEGHLHYFLDVIAPTTPGVPAVASPGTWATTASTTYTLHNVGSGNHTLSVELVNNDHTPLNPPVVATMQFLVVPELGAPKAVILTPLDGAVAQPGDVTVTVEADNLPLVEPTGQTPAPGEGHILYFMDVTAPTNPGNPATTETGTYAATAATSYTWHDVPAGTHTFSIELVDDEDNPLTPAVVSTVTISVK